MAAGPPLPHGRGGGDVFVVGPYTITDRIGSGGSAEVFRAVHRPTSLRVAFKCVGGAALDPRARAAVHREAEAVAGLDHPNVVLLLDRGTVDEGIEAASGGALLAGSPWLVMEHASGGALRLEHVPSWDVLADALRTVLDALAHAHARGLVHRDLKPPNVLVAGPDDLRPGLKLADFGLAWTDGRPRVAAASAGTPLYMAPEQVRGRTASFGPWTDLYALGVLAWELATGLPPFHVGTPQQVARQHVRDEPPGFAPRLDVPEGFEAWLRRLLAKRPSERPASAAEAALQLEILGGGSGRGAVGGLLATPAPAPDRRSLGSTARTTFDLVEGPTDVDDDRAPSPAPRDRPTIPDDWRGAGSYRVPPGLVGTGLGLFALRGVALTGRDEERDALWAVARDALRGDARAVVIRGGAGVGKSRLARWLAERVAELGVATVWRAEHAPDRPGPAALAAMAERALAARSDGARPEALAALTRGDAHVDQAVFAITDAAREGPIVVCFDDAHVGATSLVVARRVLDWCAAEPGPVLLVLTVDDAELAARDSARRALGRLLEHEAATEQILHPLTDDETRALARDLLGLDGSLVAELASRSGGNPAWLVAVVHDLVDRGLLRASPGGYRRVEGAVEGTLSETRSWAARLAPFLDALAPARRDAALVLALLGREVEDVDWSVACRALGVDADATALDPLVRRRLLRAEEGRWTFTDAHAREALEALAAAGGHADALHLACARAIEARPEGAATLSRRGHHLHAAGRPGPAADLLLRAAHLEVGGDDPELALHIVGRAARALADAGAPPHDPRHGDAVAIRLAALAARHDLDAVLVEGEAALRASEGLAGWEASRAEMHLLVGVVCTRLHRLDEARAHLERYRAACAPEKLPQALRRLADIATIGRRADEAEALLQAAIEAGPTPIVYAAILNALGTTAAIRRDAALAEARYREAYELTASLGLPDAALGALNVAGCQLGRDAVEEAHATVLTAVKLARRTCSPFYLAAATSVLLHTAARRGDLACFDEAWPRACALLGQRRLTDPSIALSLWRAGIALREAGDLLRAEATLRLALTQYVLLGRDADAERVRGWLDELPAPDGPALAPGR